MNNLTIENNTDDFKSAYQKMASLPFFDDYLPIDFNIQKNSTHYCIDHVTEQKLQNQRQLTFSIVTPILVYAGIKLGGKLGTIVSTIGIAYGLSSYAQFQAIKGIDDAK